MKTFRQVENTKTLGETTRRSKRHQHVRVGVSELVVHDVGSYNAGKCNHALGDVGPELHLLLGVRLLFRKLAHLLLGHVERTGHAVEGLAECHFTLLDLLGRLSERRNDNGGKVGGKHTDEAKRRKAQTSQRKQKRQTHKNKTQKKTQKKTERKHKRKTKRRPVNKTGHPSVRGERCLFDDRFEEFGK